MKTAAEVRQSFLDFFKSKGHEIVPSSPVVLPADPTLLFANAGMNQFKEIFLGARRSEYKRVADTQKCIRVSGKHNDLEEVGYDTYHHTFFEMLGNWSFGDYYKREAIAWAWELLTGVWGLPKGRLWATVYHEDSEAEAIWKEVTDIDPSHILRFGEKDNFWEMGETGPCGPCSEIHFDRTPDGCSPNMVNAANPDVMEIWNLVFIQFNRRSDGSVEELPAKHVDTGMGLERVVAVIQGRPSNYDTDLFMPLIRYLEQKSGNGYVGEHAVAMRVMADHVRTLSFAIADGVLPSNEGRGYVLRRLLRRAARHGRRLGFREPVLYTMVPVLETVMGDAFPELRRHSREIMRAIRAEEESFAGTLDRGIELFEEVAESVRASGSKAFPAADAFKLYDTYGFPYDLTAVMAHEKGLSMDRAAFDALMAQQRDRGREARKATVSGAEGDLIADLVGQGIQAKFTGYDRVTEESEVIALLRHGEGGTAALVETLGEGEAGAVVLAATPFYAEKGGQVGDRGSIVSGGAEFEVEDTVQPAEGLVLHVGKAKRGSVSRGARATARVDDIRRGRTARHHTATHLLQWALRKVVSPNIKQAGSMVSPEGLRFDFNYFEPIPPEQLAAVERMVNEKVVANQELRTYEMALKDVPASGIVALFDEKYGDRVRVVDINGESRELCGGTHVDSTGDIGLFRIVSESSIASGVRRIEAICGIPAYERMCRDRDLLQAMAKSFSVAPEELPGRVEALAEQSRRLQKELKQHEAAAALGQADGILAGVCDVKGVKLVAASVGDVTADAMKSLLDGIRQKMGPGVIVLGGSAEGKGSFLASVSKDLVGRGVHAGKLVKAIAALAGGGGGGQPDLARAGAKDAAGVPDAIRQVAAILEKMV